MNLKVSTNFWIHLANWWQTIEPPFRPSKVELKIYEKFLRRVIKNKNCPKILILGATPELRDLAHKFKAEVTSVDISLDMILAMTKIIKHQKEAQKEIWIKSNWLAMSLAKNYWDVVLGDDPIGNVPFYFWLRLVKKVAELLKPNGYFIVRHFHLFPNQTKDIDKIIKQLKKITYKSISPEELYILLGYTTYNFQSGEVHDPYNKLKKYWQKGRYEFRNLYLNRLVNQMYKKFPPSKKVWWHVSRERGEKIFKKYFRLIQREYPNKRVYPTLSRVLPIYLLKKK